MKVLIVAQHVNFFRNLETVMRELCRRGHQVVFLHGVDFDDPRAARKLARRVGRGKFVLTRGLMAAESEIPGVTSGHRPKALEVSCRLLRNGRQVMNRATYLRKGHPSSRLAKMFGRELPPRLADRVARAPWKQLLRSPAAMKAWRCIEDTSPASPTLLSLLAEVDPQVMLVTPTVWPKELVEADYVHAGRCAGIPTLGFVNSWDNLTSKGTIHVLPDQLMVWNEPMALEAVELHLVPPEIVRIVGAPHLDHFFSMRATATREEICADMGCPTDRPYVIHLCSSRTLIESEVDLVTRLATELSRQVPDQTPTLVVRPHPTNPGPWADYERPGVVVHPRGGDQADSPDSWQRYFNQLAFGACAFGLNSTAFLEAVVAGRPCLTIVADEFWGAQGCTGHFRHLLKGDFLEVAGDVAGATQRIVRIIGGADEKREQRLAFARWFLRPCGLDRPAAQVIADMIERSAIWCDARRTSEAEPIPGLTLRSETIGR